MINYNNITKTVTGTSDPITLTVGNGIYAINGNAIGSIMTDDGLCTSSYVDEAMDKAEELKKEREALKRTKTKIYRKGDHDVIKYYDDGIERNAKYVPCVDDVLFYNRRCVKVKFADGTTETAVLNPNEDEVLTAGIAICYLKKMLEIGRSGYGNNAFNKVIERALEAMVRSRKKELETKEKEEKAKAIAKRQAEKKQRKAQRRKERRVQELAEAIARANKEE